MSVLRDPKLERMLADLHARSDAQVALVQRHGAEAPSAEEIKAFRRDKLVALDRDKAEFCYLLCRANNARRIVEVGTREALRLSGVYTRLPGVVSTSKTSEGLIERHTAPHSSAYASAD